jgi:hypothetical protein
VAGDVRQILGWLRSRSEDLRAALEVDLIAAHPARNVGRRRRAADVHDERNVVDIDALLRRAAQPLGQLERGEADAELVLERLAEAEVGRQ